jgi:uncharacterized protein YjbJ (UPF0337 family)
MNISQLENTWDTLKGKLKQRYGILTDDDLTFAEGKGEELVGRLQEKPGVSREELESALDELESTAHGKVEEEKAKAAEISSGVAYELFKLLERVGPCFDKTRFVRWNRDMGTSRLCNQIPARRIPVRIGARNVGYDAL